MSVLDIDGDLLERFTKLAVDFLVDDLWFGDRQLITLATHGLDEDPQMQFAATRHRELIGIFGRLDA